MANNQEDSQKECFIITPVGADNSDIRRSAEGVIDSGISPVLQELGYKINVPHRLWGSGSITKNVINCIVNNELAIANLTSLNPNVMYELGIRHAARKPVIHICEKGTELPFDIKPERTIFYVNDMMGIQEFKKNLKGHIAEIMKETVTSNPVYDAIQAATIMQKMDGESSDPLKYVLAKLDEMDSKINRWNMLKGRNTMENTIEEWFELPNNNEIVFIEKKLENYMKHNSLIPNQIIDQLRTVLKNTSIDSADHKFFDRMLHKAIYYNKGIGLKENVNECSNG